MSASARFVNGLVATPIEGKTVQCPFEGRPVFTQSCAKCTRGFIVEVDGKPSYALCPDERGSGTVGHIMSRGVTSVVPELPLERLILLLVDSNIGAVPVVDDMNRPIGMASRSDLIFDDYDWAELRDETLSRRVKTASSTEAAEGNLFLGELLRSTTVRDIMSANPVILTPRTSIVEAARTMATLHIHGCPVVDGNGCLIAMVTTLDVARWVGTRGDGDSP